MAFFKDLGRGFSSHVDAFRFLFKNGLWVYFIYPMLIAIVLFIVGMSSMFVLKDWITDWIMDKSGLSGDSVVSAWAGEWVKSALHWLIGGLLTLLAFFLLNTFYKYIVLIILSPVLAYLSERIEEEKTGKKYPFHFPHFVKDVLRGILITLRNMSIETLILLACLIIAWLPVIGWLTAPFLYIVSSYFLGFSMMDYTCERRRLSIRKGVHLVRRHKGIAIGNGIVFNLLLLIPFVGLCVAPILSVTAATLATMEVLDAPANPAAGNSPNA